MKSRSSIVPACISVAGLLAIGNTENAKADSFIYWTEQGEVLRARTDGSGAEVVVSGSGSWRGIAIDDQNRKIYWANYTNGVLYRANLDGSSLETVISGIVNPVGVAVDPAGGHLFWTEYGSGGNVRRSSLNGTGAVTLTSNTTNPTGLFYASGYVYWTDWFNSYNSVRRIPAGGGSITSVATGIDGPYGVAVRDVWAYFGDFTTDTIYRRHVDGSGSLETVTGGSVIAGDPWGVGIDPSNGIVYWACQASRKLCGWNPVIDVAIVILSPLNTPWGVAVANLDCPSIGQQPVSQSLGLGQQIVLTVTASASKPISYQWKKNGVNVVNDARVSGAESATLTIGNAGPSDAGEYTVIVTADTCALASSAASVLVICPADYNRDGFVDGIDSDQFNNDFENPDPAQQMRADFNGDGFVDGIDYDQFMNAFEGGC